MLRYIAITLKVKSILIICTLLESIARHNSLTVYYFCCCVCVICDAVYISAVTEVLQVRVTGLRLKFFFFFKMGI